LKFAKIRTNEVMEAYKEQNWWKICGKSPYGLVAYVTKKIEEALTIPKLVLTINISNTDIIRINIGLHHM
jgi:hypothetical protein